MAQSFLFARDGNLVALASAWVSRVSIIFKSSASGNGRTSKTVPAFLKKNLHFAAVSSVLLSFQPWGKHKSIDTTTLSKNVHKHSSESQSIESKMQEFGRLRGVIPSAHISESFYFLTLLYELLSSSLPLLVVKLLPFSACIFTRTCQYRLIDSEWNWWRGIHSSGANPWATRQTIC